MQRLSRELLLDIFEHDGDLRRLGVNMRVCRDFHTCIVHLIRQRLKSVKLTVGGCGEMTKTIQCSWINVNEATYNFKIVPTEKYLKSNAILKKVTLTLSGFPESFPFHFKVVEDANGQFVRAQYDLRKMEDEGLRLRTEAEKQTAAMYERQRQIYELMKRPDLLEKVKQKADKLTGFVAPTLPKPTHPF